MPVEITPPVKKENSAKPESKTLMQWLKSLDSNTNVTSKDRMFFTEQLVLLLETGTNLHAALLALKTQADKPSMQQLIDDIMTDISEGKSFSFALSRHTEVFDTTYINLIAASESGGFMHEVLSQLLQMEEKREELRNTLVSAFTYPAFLIVFSISVVIFVLVVVFPKFGDMFESIHDQLPATTIILMATSDFLIKYWAPFFAAIVALILLIRYWMMQPAGTRQLDHFKLSAPVIKEVFVKLYLVQTLKVMSMSLNNGVSIMDTLSACKHVVKNTVFQRFLVDVETHVQEGAGVAIGFSKAEFIPPIVEQMILTGEESGNLPKVMARVAEYYERELTQRLAVLSKLAEPIMLLVMGLVVGILVSSLILPIFKLSRAVH